MLKPFMIEGRIEAGCDEAGRGCLAGDVYAAAVILPPGFSNDMLNDSKQLTEARRYMLREVIEREALAWSVGVVTAEEIDRMALGTSHGGILAECGERKIPYLTDAQDAIVPNGFYVMLQGIEDPYNFGYALRSLYACGADGIILDERNWLSAAGVVARASAGASERFAAYVADPLEAADIFHERGYRIVCADERTDEVLHKADLKKPILLIVGGERRGISRGLVDRADLLVKISYGRPFAASLSAASASTILGYEIFRQNED